MRACFRDALAITLLMLACAPAAAEDESPATSRARSEPLKPGANSFAESQARALLQSKGYANVSPLMNDRNGIWHGTATKDEKRVNVSVDFQGHVAER